jgi:hypothetical protein
MIHNHTLQNLLIPHQGRRAAANDFRASEALNYMDFSGKQIHIINDGLVKSQKMKLPPHHIAVAISKLAQDIVDKNCSPDFLRVHHQWQHLKSTKNFA